MATRIVARSGALPRAVLLAAGTLLLAAAGLPATEPTSPAVTKTAKLPAGSTPVHTETGNPEAVRLATPTASVTVVDAEAATTATRSGAMAAAALLADDSDVVARPARLDTLVAEVDAGDLGGQHRCLAEAVYHESRGEPLEGQLAVAQAIVNRVESGRFAPTLCGVITQKGQFSFRLGQALRSGQDWARARAIAAIAMGDLWQDLAPNAVAFHAVHVRPGWRGMKRIATIGRHVFYK